MGKLTTLLLIMSGLDLLFYISGLATGSTSLLNLLLNPSNIFQQSFAVTATQVFSTAVAATITIGASFQNIRYALIAPFTFFLFNLFQDFLAVIMKVYSVAPIFALLFGAPILIIFIMTCVAFWDTALSA